MIHIEIAELDDEGFIEIIQRFVNTCLRQNEPESFFIIKVDHWFDFKWKGFQGKMLGAVGSWNSEQLRLPPFIPDRIITQSFYVKAKNGYQLSESELLHTYRSSGENITGYGRIYGTGQPRLFFWFSGETKATQRGSLMAYFVDENKMRSIYVSFLRKTEWSVYKTNGLSRNEGIDMFQDKTG